MSLEGGEPGDLCSQKDGPVPAICLHLRMEPAGCHTALGGSDFFCSKLKVEVSWLAQGLAVDPEGYTSCH